MKMDKYNIDYHKLHFHPKRVSEWLEGEKIFPIYAEISLTSACNFRCVWCGPNFFLNYKPEYIETDVIKMTLTNMADVGVKAVMFGGEGEGTLHKDFAEIVKHAKESGLDVALTTNGLLYTKKLATKTLQYLSWIKFSLDSCNAETYARLHGTKKENIKIVFDNIIHAVQLRNSTGCDCTIGGQAILLKDNLNSIIPLVRFLKTVKADYLAIKPFSEHEKRIGDELELPTREDIEKLKVELSKEDFNVIFRDMAFSNLDRERCYYKCYAQDFCAYINTLGGVSSCINFIGDDKFCYGNIYEDTFENIWINKKEIKPNLNRCREICRLDSSNRYLWDLKHPHPHVNFI